MFTVAGKGAFSLPRSYLVVFSSHATLWSGWDSENRHPCACPGFWTLAKNAGTMLLALLREWRKVRWKVVETDVEKQWRVEYRLESGLESALQSGTVSDAESE